MMTQLIQTWMSHLVRARILTLFLLSISFGCKGQDNKAAESPPPQKVMPSPPKTLRYGNYLLDQASWDESFGGYYLYSGKSIDGDVLYEITEKLPGVLLFYRRPVNYDAEPRVVTLNHPTIEIYDTATLKLKKRINLEATSPFTPDKYPNLTYGSFDYEGMEIDGLDSTCQWPNKSKPNKFSTFNWFLPLNNPNYFAIGYELIHLYNTIVVNREYTMEIFNINGESLGQVKIDPMMVSLGITNSGRYVVYSTSFDSWVTDLTSSCDNKIVVYDLKERKIVFERATRSLISDFPLVSGEPNRLRYITTEKDNEKMVTYIFDLSLDDNTIYEWTANTISPDLKSRITSNDLYRSSMKSKLTPTKKLEP